MPYPSDSDAGRFLAGDPHAVGEAIRRVSREIVFGRVPLPAADRSELCQECLRRVVEALRRGRFDDSRDFGSYVRGVARMTLLQEAARSMRARRTLLAIWSEPEPRGGTDAERAAGRHELAERALSLLDEDGQALVESYFLQEKSYEEIAHELGVPVGTVKSRLFRCLEEVGRKLRAVRPVRGNRVRDRRTQIARTNHDVARRDS